MEQLSLIWGRKTFSSYSIELDLFSQNGYKKIKCHLEIAL